LVRTRLTIQTTQQKYQGIWHTFKTVVQEEGALALYKGVGTSASVRILLFHERTLT
jgi:hypothetical protein